MAASEKRSRPEAEGSRRAAAGRVAVVLVAAVVVSAFVGSVAAASATVNLDAALDDQQQSKTMSFTFTPDQNGTVTASGSREFQGGDVVFAFESWENTDTGASGGSRSWTVQKGDTYRVTYTATASSGANEGTYDWTASVEYDGGGTAGSETLSLAVNLQYPQFGGATSPTTEVIFESSSAASGEVDVQFDNTGQGVMVPESVSTDAPSGISVSVDSLSGQVEAGGTGTASFDISVDPSVDVGTYTVTGTITDNLGNTQSFSFDVTVRKPPVLSVDNVDVGGVLRGRSTTVDVTLSEVAGFSGTDSVTVNVLGSDQDGSLTVTGESTVNIDAGGSDTISVEVAAAADADQHAGLDWQVEVTPSNQDSPTASFEVTGQVFYPPNLGTVSAQGARNVFDVPRSQADVQESTTEVTFENTGDLPMEITDISVSVDSPDVTARVANAPQTVDGLSTGTAEIVLAADPDTPEGSYPFTVQVQTATAGSKSITRDLQIVHVPRLSVERQDLNLGDVTVTNRKTTSIDVSEVLGYESVQNLEIVQTSGPDDYLAIAERPTALEPGQSAPLVFAVSFGTSAELYQVYEWTFEIRGEGVETRTVTVTARPIPYSFDTIVQNLSAYSNGDSPAPAAASGMVDALNALETRLKNGRSVPEGDLTETIAAGQTAALLLDSLEAANRARTQNGSAAAQEEVLRARATLNAMTEYVDRIQAPQVKAAASGALSAARAATAQQVETQIQYYRSRLEGDVTTLQRANAKRQLARLAAIRGNTERAKQLRSEANRAFDRYLTQVEDASESAERARRIRSSIRENATVVLFDQPLVLNPARLDPISAKIDRIESAYTTAAQTYARAGATQQAEAVRAERAQTLQRLQITQYGLWGATGVYGLVVAFVLLRTGRNLYAYLRDLRTVQLGADLQ
ncbi:MAG: hypothetical protein ABEK02_01945 [Haloquadratum sp.]